MFPVVKVNLSGMDPEAYYMVLMDVVPVDDYRYRYLGKRWLPTQPTDDVGEHPKPRLCLHDQGPRLGSQWMAAPVDFANVKLTNQPGNSERHVSHRSQDSAYAVGIDDDYHLPKETYWHLPQGGDGPRIT